MKNYKNRKTIWNSIISIFFFAIFLFFAFGSTALFGLLGVPVQTTSEYDEQTGEYYERTTGFKGESGDTTWTQHVNTKKDSQGFRQGNTEITNSNYSKDEETGAFRTRRSIEEVYLENGRRSGMSVTRYISYEEYDDDDKWYNEVYYSDTVCYDYGNVIPCSEINNDLKASEIASGFSILQSQYPWFLDALNVVGFEDDYVKSYMDTVELLLNEIEFEPEDFHNEYDDVVEILEETPYDSIIVINKMLTSVYGVEILKEFEFRLAVIDQQRQNEFSTFEIIEQHYPHLIEGLNDAGMEATEQEFKAFCHQFDSLMTKNEPVPQDDPYFTDSVDVRMKSAILTIFNTREEEALMALKAQKMSPADIINQIDVNLKSLFAEGKTPKQIAQFMVLQLYSKYLIDGDIPRQAFLEAYYQQHQIVQLPVVTTQIFENGPSDNASVEGKIINDGGDEITDKGIVWATFYNPNINDNVVKPQTKESFVVTIQELKKGETYYARAYATNSAGTAYGNNISFEAGNTVGLHQNKLDNFDINVYPNPASEKLTICFQADRSENFHLTISTITGRVIINKNFGLLGQGENQISLDISNLESGIYNCTLTKNNATKSTRKLLIMH